MLFIRSLLFNILFYLWTAFLCITLPVFIFAIPNDYIKYIGKVWANFTNLLLKYICRLTYTVTDLTESIKGPILYLSKHESAWETIMFHSMVDGPIFVLKQELTKIPLYGLILKKMGMIAIDRSKGVKSLKIMEQEVQDTLNNGRSVVIFPEGTRIAHGREGKINSGTYPIYRDIVHPIAVVAHDAGKFWPKSSFWVYPGNISVTIEILSETGLEKQEFLRIMKTKLNKNNSLYPSYQK